MLKNNGKKNCTDDNWSNEPHCYLYDSNKHEAIQPYTYVIQSQIQPYWDMAKQYVLGDETFSSNNGPTFVSHQYMIAGQAAHSAEVPSTTLPNWGCDGGTNETEKYLAFGEADPPVYGPKVGHEYIGPIRVSHWARQVRRRRTTPLRPNSITPVLLGATTSNQGRRATHGG